MHHARIGELLLKSGVLSETQLATALREQQRTGVRFGQILVDHGMVEEATLYDALAQAVGADRFNLRIVALDKNAMNLVTPEFALEKSLLPFRLDAQHRTLHVAVSDPTNLAALDDFGFKHGVKIKLYVASETEIQRCVRHHFFGDPLDRDPRNVNRASGPRQTGDIDPSSIVMGMDRIRDELLGSQDILPVASGDDRTALLKLRPIYDAQEDAARALRAIFDLCVARGIITPEEYLERLKKS